MLLGKPRELLCKYYLVKKITLGLPQKCSKVKTAIFMTFSCFYSICVKILHETITDFPRVFVSTTSQKDYLHSDSWQSSRFLWRNKLIFQLSHAHYITECILKFSPEDPRKLWLGYCLSDWRTSVEKFKPEHTPLLSNWSTGVGFDYVCLLCLCSEQSCSYLEPKLQEIRDHWLRFSTQKMMHTDVINLLWEVLSKSLLIYLGGESTESTK